MHKLYELKELLCDNLEEYAGKDRLDMNDLEIVDKLAHAIKNIDKIIAEKEGYSERYSRGNYGNYGNRGNYEGRGNYENRGNYEMEYENSYARRRRDSRGRYASDMAEDIREIMNKTSDPQTRQMLERIMRDM